jgi:hypothetical protein
LDITHAWVTPKWFRNPRCAGNCSSQQ